MEFDWMDYTLPEEIKTRNAEHLKRSHLEEIKDRASMLKRLGYDHEYVLHRIVGNQNWGVEMNGAKVLESDEIKKVVNLVFGVTV